MKRSYYFDDYEFNKVCNDFTGNKSDLIKYAQKIANETNKDILINDCITGEILEVIHPNNYV